MLAVSFRSLHRHPPVPFRRAGGRQVKEHFLPKVVPSLQLKVAGYTWYWSGTPQSTGSHVTCLFHFPSMQVMVTLDSVWKKTHGYNHHSQQGRDQNHVKPNSRNFGSQGQPRLVPTIIIWTAATKPTKAPKEQCQRRDFLPPPG